MAIIIEHMEMPNGCCECRMQTENCCTLSLRPINDIYDRPEWCLLTEAEPICSICKSSTTGFDFKPLKHTEERKNCPMRHENGNCLAIGGFCLAVNDEICHGLHNAYNKGVKAEPKIKCKECKHSSYEPCEGYDNVYVCNRTPFARMEGGRLPNFYCGYGERREE